MNASPTHGGEKFPPGYHISCTLVLLPALFPLALLQAMIIFVLPAN